ncbi:MAG: HU family DNA-binding protein [Candidatus Glassbacteria bacterium]|nr:HU family DNA-binding protein [Candidatus Glassbacteria bacterium]
MPKELFGQYLIRKGKVKQHHIDEALMLQEILHESLGAVALAHDLISFKDVECILEKIDSQGKGFSETAVDLGILSQQQVEKIRKKYPDQRIYIGQLLVATGKLTRRELEEDLEKFQSERELVSITKLTKARLIKIVARRTGLRRGTARKVLEGMVDSLSRALADGETVTLRGFGTFKSSRYLARTARNPRTGKSISIPDRRIPRLRYTAKLRRRVENGTASSTKR